MFQQIDQYADILLLAAGGLLLLSITSQIILFFKFNQINRNYKRLTRGVTKKNLEEVVLQLIDKVAENNDNLEIINNKQKEILAQLNKCLKTPEITRYNAFEQMGSDLSFTAAFLDNELNGLILTSIYGRNESRIYAKPINKGKSEYLLTPEEQAVIDGFMQKNNLQN